jgi:hypothetical protein
VAAELSNAARLVLDELPTERLVAASSKVLHHLRYVPTADGLLIFPLKSDQFYAKISAR